MNEKERYHHSAYFGGGCEEQSATNPLFQEEDSSVQNDFVFQTKYMPVITKADKPVTATNYLNHNSNNNHIVNRSDTNTNMNGHVMSNSHGMKPQQAHSPQLDCSQQPSFNGIAQIPGFYPILYSPYPHPIINSIATTAIPANLSNSLGSFTQNSTNSSSNAQQASSESNSNGCCGECKSILEQHTELIKSQSRLIEQLMKKIDLLSEETQTMKKLIQTPMKPILHENSSTVESTISPRKEIPDEKSNIRQLSEIKYTTTVTTTSAAESSFIKSVKPKSDSEIEPYQSYPHSFVSPFVSPPGLDFYDPIPSSPYSTKKTPPAEEIPKKPSPKVTSKFTPPKYDSDSSGYSTDTSSSSSSDEERITRGRYSNGTSPFDSIDQTEWSLDTKNYLRNLPKDLHNSIELTNRSSSDTTFVNRSSSRKKKNKKY